MKTTTCKIRREMQQIIFFRDTACTSSMSATVKEECHGGLQGGRSVGRGRNGHGRNIVGVVGRRGGLLQTRVLPAAACSLHAPPRGLCYAHYMVTCLPAQTLPHLYSLIFACFFFSDVNLTSFLLPPSSWSDATNYGAQNRLLLFWWWYSYLQSTHTPFYHSWAFLHNRYKRNNMPR